MNEKSFIECVAEILTGKFVEVYVGTTGFVRKYADHETSHKDVIRGILKETTHNMLVMDVEDGTGARNNVYVNVWSITCIIEPKNGMSTIDVFFDEHEKTKK